MYLKIKPRDKFFVTIFTNTYPKSKQIKKSFYLIAQPAEKDQVYQQQKKEKGDVCIVVL